jgi:D-3-phosphoglycerate dehydrogenase
MRRAKILVASSIDPTALERLREEHDVVTALGAPTDALQRAIADREVLIFRSGVSITARVMEKAPHLRLLIRGGSGTDNVDLDYVRRRGLHLERVPGPGARAVAEMSLALMLALSRNLVPADRSMRQGRWAKSEMAGTLLRGKTLGVVGLGNIGFRVAELGRAVGMEVAGCVEHPSPERAARLGLVGVRLTGCDEVLAAADYVSIHVPLKDSTRYLINEERLARVKPGAFLINLARGGVVDEQALYRALTQGERLRGAALDVHEQEGDGKLSPLAGLSNVILTPHIGASTEDSQREIGARILEIIASYVAGSFLAPDLEGAVSTVTQA